MRVWQWIVAAVVIFLTPAAMQLTLDARGENPAIQKCAEVLSVADTSQAGNLGGAAWNTGACEGLSDKDATEAYWRSSMMQQRRQAVGQ